MLNVISVFSGAAGLDLGLEAAGFKTKVCVEIDPVARKTIKINRPNWKLTENGDIFENSAKSLLKKAELKTGEVFLLAGGPPCQPYSNSGNWAGSGPQGMADPRGKTLHAYIKLIEDLLPEVILLENVKGFVTKKESNGYDELKKRIQIINKEKKVNYQLQYYVLDAASYGVPQHRERVFIIAHKKGKLLELPNATHGTIEQSYISAYDALKGVKPEPNYKEDVTPTGKWAELLPSIPEGENYLWHTEKKGGKPLFGWRTRYWNFLLKLKRDKPSWTLQASPGPSTGPFHWDNRKFYPAELKRLQTFPDNYQLYGSYRDIVKQIGNAVPPAMAELLGLEIRRQFLGSRVRRKLKLIVDQTSNVSKLRALPVKRVPNKYQELVGEHAPHPGVGLGPGSTFN